MTGVVRPERVSGFVHVRTQSWLGVVSAKDKFPIVMGVSTVIVLLAVMLREKVAVSPAPDAATPPTQFEPSDQTPPAFKPHEALGINQLLNLKQL
jgi:hypothetical protein